MNVRLLLASVLLLTSPFAAFSQSNSSLSDSALAQQVIEAEHAWANAFQGCDPDADTLTTDDFTFTDGNGMSYSRLWFMRTAAACERKVVRIALKPFQPSTLRQHLGATTSRGITRCHRRRATSTEHHLSHQIVRQNRRWKVEPRACARPRSCKIQLRPVSEQYVLTARREGVRAVAGCVLRHAAKPAFEPMVAR